MDGTLGLDYIFFQKMVKIYHFTRKQYFNLNNILDLEINHSTGKFLFLQTKAL